MSNLLGINKGIGKGSRLMEWILIGALALVGALIGALIGVYSLNLLAKGNKQETGQIAAPPAEPEETALSPTPDEQIKKEVLDKKYESVQIGGATLLIQTLPADASEEEVAVIFEQVKDKEALVNVALEEKVHIKKVQLITVNARSDNREFFVSMEIENLTKDELRVKIPKGQVFENKQTIPRRQSLTAAADDTIIIPALSTITTRNIKAFCVNKGFDAPNNLGNITIFELKNKFFVNQNEVWNWIEDNIYKSGNESLLESGNSKRLLIK